MNGNWHGLIKPTLRLKKENCIWLGKMSLLPFYKAVERNKIYGYLICLLQHLKYSVIYSCSSLPKQ